MIEKVFYYVRARKKPASVEMVYCGSKSIVPLDLSLAVNTIVKEQRVNGNWCEVYTSPLRSTLRNFERNYRIKIPSNHIINKLRTYTVKGVLTQNNIELNP